MIIFHVLRATPNKYLIVLYDMPYHLIGSSSLIFSQLKQDYIQEGGNDLNILSMLHNLQAEASKAEPDVGVDGRNVSFFPNNLARVLDKTK